MQEGGDLVCCAVAGSAELRAALLGGTCPRKAVEQLLEAGEAWGNLRFLREVPQDDSPESVHTFTADIAEQPDDEGAWQPSHALLAPMRNSAGRKLDRDAVGRRTVQTAGFRRAGLATCWTFRRAGRGSSLLNARRHEEAEARMQRLEREHELPAPRTSPSGTAASSALPHPRPGTTRLVPAWPTR